MIEPLVTPERFSEIACMDGRVFGVIAACEPCDFTLNSCMRRHLRESLIANQQKVEEELGYALTARYHEEEILWDGHMRAQLSQLGVVALNVRPRITKLSGTHTISPFVIVDAPISDGAGFCVVTLDKTYIDNPGKALVRDATTNSIIAQQHTNGYPKRDVDGNWQIALEAKTPCDSLSVNVQHCRYMTLTIPTPVCTGELRAVQTGTTDKFIPFAKTPTVSGGNTTFWFYPWSLIDPAFEDDDEINLLSGEFYKLMTAIEFVCITDEFAPPVITERDDWCALKKSLSDPTLNPETEPTETDLSISVIGNPTEDVQPGESITYIVTVFNTGKADATGVEVTVLLPSGYAFDGASTSQGDYDDETGIWTVGGILAGQNATLGVVARALAFGQYEFTAEITAHDQIDPDADDQERAIIPVLEDPDVSAEIINAADAIIRFKALRRCAYPFKVKIFYKTDPAVIGIDLHDIQEAIAYLTAAEMPTSSCGCDLKDLKNFIADAQKPYTEIRINPVTGETFAPLKYGNLHGQLVFAERLLKAPRRYRLVKA